MGEGVTQGMECMEGSAMYFMSTFEKQIKNTFFYKKKKKIKNHD